MYDLTLKVQSNEKYIFNYNLIFIYINFNFQYSLYCSMDTGVCCVQNVTGLSGTVGWKQMQCIMGYYEESHTRRYTLAGRLPCCRRQPTLHYLKDSDSIPSSL